MSFCPACGRQRTDSNRFCGGCGYQFSEPLAAEPAQAEPAAAEPATAGPTQAREATAAVETVQAAEPTGWDTPEDVTRWDRPAEVTHWDAPKDAAPMQPPAGQPAPAEPDPFAAWFAPQAPESPAGQPVPPRTANPDPWQIPDTVYAAPNQQRGYPPPSQAAPAYPPPQGPVYPPSQGPVNGAPPRGPSRAARGALITLAVLLVLGAGGAAYALFPRSNTSSASTPPATTSAAATPTTPATASGSPSTSPPASATASASPSPSVVSIARGVGSNPATPQVEMVLSHYFQGINTRSYPEYASALDAQERAKQTQSFFDSGYSTTTDSGMTLTSIASTGNGGLAATVAFTSHQSAAESVDKSTCNNWTLTFYLVPQGTGYLDGPAPASYRPAYTDC